MPAEHTPPVGAGIAGVAMALPERLVSNEQIAATIGVDSGWIAKRTGTRERPWAGQDERLSELAARAGRAAVQRAGLEPADLDLVLVATSSADEICPNAAPLVAGVLGADRAAALDVGAACTGWISALAVACGQLESGRARHALVIGADFLSRFLDLSDRESAPVFADGTGAAVVSATDAPTGRIGPMVLHCDHRRAHLIQLTRGGRIRVEGPDTYRTAVTVLADVTTEALAASGHTASDISLFVYHQANSRILRAVGERLGLPPARVIDYVDRFANSSCATLPIALSVAESEGRLGAGDLVLVAAFGGGLTWGGTVLQWPQADNGLSPM